MNGNNLLVAATVALGIFLGTAQAATITQSFTAGSTSTNDGAQYFGTSSTANVTSLSLSLAWDTNGSDYTCNDTASESRCVLHSGLPTAMAAAFAGTSNSTPYAFEVNSDATVFQNAHSPEGGSLVDASSYGGGTQLHFYVVGQGMLEAGDIYSSTAFSSNSVLDANFMSAFGQNVYAMDWFLSAPWSAGDSTYYPNGGDYFGSFGALADAVPSTPEPATWLSLFTGLSAIAWKRRKA